MSGEGFVPPASLATSAPAAACHMSRLLSANPAKAGHERRVAEHSLCRLARAMDVHLELKSSGPTSCFHDNSRPVLSAAPSLGPSLCAPTGPDLSRGADKVSWICCISLEACANSSFRLR